MRKGFVIYTLVITLMFQIMPVFAEMVLIDETVYIEDGHYYYVSDIFESGYKIMVNIETDGDPVDIYLMDSADFDEYQAFMSGQGTSFHYYSWGSAKSIVQKTYSFTIPKTDRYYIVVDNAYTGVEGEAYAGVPVNVHMKITVEFPETTSEKSPGFTCFTALTIISIISLISLKKFKKLRK